MGFRFEQKILFKHCDPAGIVFYPRYFVMINDTVEAWFDEALGLPFEAMHAETGVPTVTITADFTAPSRHGDRLVIDLVPTRLGGTSVDLTLTASCAGETRFVCRLTLVNVALDTMRPARWPEPQRGLIAAAIPPKPDEETHAAE
jgi:4-hydroxybenzoyl-CoA thioesterase